jgi:tRNA(Arg) A34 adenosine deaminase TadA
MNNMTSLTTDQMKFLRRAIAVAQRSRDKGNHPFGAVLVDENGKVLLEGENTVNTEHDATGHAESNLVRAACKQYDTATLAKCTLYSSTEPCPMCSGAIFWSGIGRVVYALTEAGLYAFAPDSPEKLPLGCREVLAHGGRGVEVVGPAIEDEARVVHAGFWGN